jgi:hypothetical protein
MMSLVERDGKIWDSLADQEKENYWSQAKIQHKALSG